MLIVCLLFVLLSYFQCLGFSKEGLGEWRGDDGDRGRPISSLHLNSVVTASTFLLSGSTNL